MTRSCRAVTGVSAVNVTRRFRLPNSKWSLRCVSEPTRTFKNSLISSIDKYFLRASCISQVFVGNVLAGSVWKGSACRWTCGQYCHKSALSGSQQLWSLHARPERGCHSRGHSASALNPFSSPTSSQKLQRATNF